MAYSWEEEQGNKGKEFGGGQNREKKAKEKRKQRKCVWKKRG